ncbi:imidazole glycerol phosphate synthase subunit HisH [Sphingobacterium spiritivorum]|uniref:imidazole glycerol phosphate synthase subunit HisH n=1 Tax=Sphingobacterium spiritivorum TaxID=258 RepID=UPI001917D6CC|nr:imidazole glycerol phosphate synthase subunit HisH [Sphingobacterium spiritivorum]QQT27804.1 imidazole glycerol phosphate synthase subunit HisH [Sphingobacterium spiritivorum]
MRKRIVIVDYQLGNLFSVNQALLNVGANVLISSDKEAIRSADAIVLPGVGAFSDAMRNLHDLDLIDVLHQKVNIEKRPFLGICLGLQLLFTASKEFGNHKGLDFISGTVERFNNQNILDFSKVKVPQISWNTISYPSNRSWKDTPLEMIKNETDMYFVHSYYVKPLDQDVILSTTSYGGIEYCSSILKDNIFACQFHPEKSGERGLDIYRKWIQLNKLI